MSPWDLKLTREHLNRLYQEARSVRSVRAAKAGSGGMLSRLLLNLGELLITIGLKLKTRSGYRTYRSVEPRQRFTIDIG